MAIPQPTIGFRFDGGSTNEVFGAGTLTHDGSLTGGGLQFDTSPERASLVLPTGALPATWDMTMWLRGAIASSNYNAVFGIGRGAATTSNQQYAAAIQMTTGDTLTAFFNSTGGTNLRTTTSLGTIPVGSTTTDYATTFDVFITFSGSSNSIKGYIDSSATVGTDASGNPATTAPFYTSPAPPTLYIGALPHDAGNTRLRVYGCAIWASVLSTTQIDEVIADTGFNFLVAPQRVQRVVQVARQRTPAYVPKRQLVTAITSPITDAVTPDSGSAGFGRRRTAVFVRKNADWINRRAG